MSGLQGTASEVLISKPVSHPLGFRIMCRFMKFANYLSMREDGTIDRRIENWLEPKSPAKNTPTRGVYTKDVVVDARTGVWVRLFVPVGAASNLPEELEPRLPVVFYFHGGGFTSLSPDFVFYDTFCRRLARRRRVIVISVAYRRSPEHRYPIPYDDCFGALTWFCSGGSGRAHLPGNADLSCCFLMGDSAGGNIVHHVGCQVSAEEETMKGMRIVGHVLLQPFFGGEERAFSELRLEGDPLVYLKSSDWHWKAFLPAGADRDHLACNVFGPNDSPYYIPSLPLPPTLVVVGGHDPLQDWQLRYVENMRKMNKDAQLLCYGEAMHVFHLFCRLEISSRFISDLSSFLTKCCGN